MTYGMDRLIVHLENKHQALMTLGMLLTGCACLNPQDHNTNKYLLSVKGQHVPFKPQAMIQVVKLCTGITLL